MLQAILLAIILVILFLTKKTTQVLIRRAFY